MTKKYIIGICIALSLPLYSAIASTPMLSVYANGDGNSVTTNITNADPNTPIVLYYTSVQDGAVHTYQLGNTSGSGAFSGIVNTNNLAINGSQMVHVLINGYQSNNLMWPFTSPTSGTSQVTFSMNNPTIMNGQTGSLVLSGGNGTYYISSNSSGSIVTPTLSGNTLSYYGLSMGSSAITICSVSATTCGTVTITVNSTGNTTGNINSLILSSGGTANLMLGQSSTIQISGANPPYSISSVNGNSVSSSISGNTLTLNGMNLGASAFTVCGSNSVCTQLYANVMNTNPSNQTMMSYTIGLGINEVLKINLSGGNGAYYIQSQMSSPVIAGIVGNVLTVTGTNYGQAMVTVCQNNNTTCLPITFIVNKAAVVDNGGLNGTGGSYTFTDDLWLGVDSDGVRELQNFLATTGYFTGTATGYFGPLTQDAVMRFQTAKGVRATGYVGPLTRNAINNQ